MTQSQVINFLILWSLLGAGLFSLIVVYLFRSGRVYDARTQEGHLQERISLKGLMTILSFMGLIVIFLSLANYLSLISQGIDPKFRQLFALNLSLIIILLVYDTGVIDWLVIAHWRPAFLNLPESMDREQMVEHIRRTMFAGPLFAVILAALSAGATTLIW